MGSRFAFFIDGLDEYEGDHTDLIRTIKGLATSPSLKICLSSRPWNEFVDAFGNNHDRKMLLQELTRDDITLYVSNTLKQDSRFIEFEKKDTRSSELVQEVVDRAQGVFLWVNLVVRSLLRGLIHADDISDLQKRLRDIPQKLETYFQHMFDSIEHNYREQTAQIFKVNLKALLLLSVVALSFLEKERGMADYVFKTEIQPYRETDIEAIQGTTKKRLNARCKDLLEVSVNHEADVHARYKVDFLHRTVIDFLKGPGMWEKLTGWTSKTFHARKSLCRALVAEVKSLQSFVTDKSTLSLYVRQLLNEIMHKSLLIEQESGVSDVALLDELDQAMIHKQTLLTFDFLKKKYSDVDVKSLHWTNLEYISPLVYRSEHREKAFLAKTIECGLRLYVTQKLTDQPHLISDKRGHPLLDYALRPVSLPLDHQLSLSRVKPNMGASFIIARGESQRGNQYQQR